MSALRPLAPMILALLLTLPAPVRAETLGRLFFTPERRAVLERQRQSNVQEQVQSLEGATMSLDGVVVRSSSRRNTVWINGRPQNENEAGTAVQANLSNRQPNRASLVAGEESAADLRVGESINRATREKLDVVAPGAVAVTRSRAPAH